MLPEAMLNRGTHGTLFIFSIAGGCTVKINTSASSSSPLLFLAREPRISNIRSRFASLQIALTFFLVPLYLLIRLPAASSNFETEIPRNIISRTHRPRVSKSFTVGAKCGQIYKKFKSILFTVDQLSTRTSTALVTHDVFNSDGNNQLLYCNIRI